MEGPGISILGGGPLRDRRIPVLHFREQCNLLSVLLELKSRQCGYLFHELVKVSDPTFDYGCTRIYSAIGETQNGTLLPDCRTPAHPLCWVPYDQALEDLLAGSLNAKDIQSDS